jgi:hypothetical protein
MSRFDGKATALSNHNENNDREIILCDLRTKIKLETFRTCLMPAKIRT